MDATINIDAGGTFTDGVFTHEGGVETAKVPTTAHDLTVCFIDCIEHGAEKLGVSVPELLGDVDVVRFSTTVGTNTVIERSGPRLGLLVTAGHESDLYGGGGPTVADGFVDPDMVEGVEEAVTPEGRVEDSPDREAVIPAVKRLQERGARLVVIALANAHANPGNERRIKRLVAEEYPRHYLGAVPTLAAHEVSVRPDDERRLNTAVLDAYVHRPMKSALYRAEDLVREQGYERPLFVGHASGGMARVAKTVAISTHNSGPAAGVLGAQALADLYDRDVVAADMGGTSIDVSVVRDGEYTVELTPEIGGLETAVPAIETHNLGAGGGSIATVEDGELSVGPESAGANPGPACFGRGGEAATVTDADLVRGIVDPDYFLGGRYQLDADRGREAIVEWVAEPLGVDPEAAARRVAGAVQGTVAGGLERWAGGVDTVVAFGGAGPVHAAGFAAAAGASRVIVTPYSSVFSAFGESTMDVDHTYSSFLPRATTESVESALSDLHDEARRDMRAEGFGAAEIDVAADLLVGEGDGYAVRSLDYRADGSLGDVPGGADDGACVRLHARGALQKASFESHEPVGPDPAEARKGERDVYWEDGFRGTPIYQREELRPGNVVEGPAVVEAVDTTVAVPPGIEFEIDRYGNGVVEF